jgi:hypothetical protein
LLDADGLLMARRGDFGNHVCHALDRHADIVKGTA